MRKPVTPYIYGLVSINDGEIRYVGKSRTPQRETLWRHLRDEAKTPKTRWIARTLRRSEEVRLVVLEAGAWTVAEQNAKESAWIARLGRFPAGRLLNMTDGGDGGPTTTGKRWTEEWRRAWREGLERRKASGAFDLTRERLSRALRGKPSPFRGLPGTRAGRKNKAPSRATQWATNCSICDSPINVRRRFTCSHECKVELATRSKSGEFSCSCGFVARSKAGLSAHQRSHVEDWAA